MIEPKALTARLRSQDLRCRTGILLIPESVLGHEAEVAVHLDVDHIDFAKCLLDAVPEGGQFVDLSLAHVLKLLTDIADNYKGRGCVLVSNTDVAAMHMCSHDCGELWDRLMRDFPHQRVALVFTIPEHLDGIRVLQEESIRQGWERSGRMATWTI
jgi:hypothetical protein